MSVNGNGDVLGLPGAVSSSAALPPLARVRRLWEAHPLASALVIGGALRALAAFASTGFAFHDDQYEVVEIGQDWLDGARDWLGVPGSWRSLVYPGLHWLVFRALHAIGIDDPQGKMLVVRLLHAAWSMLGLVYGYRLAQAIGGARAARWAGLLLAAFWLAPFTSVHDLAEVVCQPPLLAALWLAAQGRTGAEGRDLFRAGLWFGLAFTFRFQTAILPAALEVVLLAERRPRHALALAAGLALSAAALQGGSDWIGYGRPFSSVLAYLGYNSDPANIAHYPRGPWYAYLGTLAGLLVPPTSLLLLWGFLHTARTAPRAFWPAAAFLVLHSLYPGKQERFLLPVLPLVLVLGVVGALAPAVAATRLLRPRVRRGLWTWFWAVNLLLLALYTTNPSKRSRIAPLTYLHERGDARAVLVDQTESGSPFVPRFYLGNPVPVYLLQPGAEAKTLASAWADRPHPNYAIIEGDRDLAARQARLQAVFPGLAPLATFEPGLVDRVLARLNPTHNVNLTTRVYRVE